MRIDPSVVDPADIETLEDLIVAAVHDARRAAEELANRTMGSVAGDLASQLDLSALGLGGLAFPGMGGAIDAADDRAVDDDEYEDDEYEDEDGQIGYAVEGAAFEVDDEDTDDPVDDTVEDTVDDTGEDTDQETRSVDGGGVADLALPGDIPPDQDPPGRDRG